MSQKSETRCVQQRAPINIIEGTDDMNAEIIPGIRNASEFLDEVHKSFQDEKTLSPLRDAVRSAPTWQTRLKAIRELYQAHERLGEDFNGFDPYSLELHDHWSPIEWRLWQDVRSLSRMDMLPQFPVGPYFLDFANPKHKIGVEADGKAFHNAVRDKARDQRLWDQYGWKVYRVSGAETFRSRPAPWEWERDYYDAHERYPSRADTEPVATSFFSNTSTGVAWAIRAIEIDRKQDKWFDEMAESLDAHRLASFHVGF